MDKKCKGCGIILQDDNTLVEGYTSSLDNDLCSRCFRMINYGDYEVSTRSNEDYLKILEAVGQTKDLVLYIADIFNLPEDLKEIKNIISNRMVLVLNKKDALPKSVKEEKIISKLKKWAPFFEDIIMVSAKKNYNLDELMLKIKHEKTSSNVYVVGNTNVGKSAIINKMIQNYSDQKASLTISPFPSTTTDKVVIKLNEDLSLIDTPGLIEEGNLSNYVKVDELKKLNPKKEIKVRVYQIKEGQSLIVGDFLRIDYSEGEKNSFSFYISDEVKIHKRNTKKLKGFEDLSKRSFSPDYQEDLVVSGLGFIKIVKKCELEIYSNINFKIFTRESLI